jgi:hypothetical protein
LNGNEKIRIFAEDNEFCSKAAQMSKKSQQKKLAAQN